MASVAGDAAWTGALRGPSMQLSAAAAALFDQGTDPNNPGTSYFHIERCARHRRLRRAEPLQTGDTGRVLGER
jgi:hypothetical protein